MSCQQDDILLTDISFIARCKQACVAVSIGCHIRGYQFRAGFLDGIKREVVTIYEIIRDAANNIIYAVPDYQFRCAPLCTQLCYARFNAWQLMCRRRCISVMTLLRSAARAKTKVFLSAVFCFDCMLSCRPHLGTCHDRGQLRAQGSCAELPAA